MATFDYTTRELRTKQALILDKADAGEDIVIHRGIRKSYMIVPIHEDCKGEGRLQGWKRCNLQDC